MLPIDSDCFLYPVLGSRGEWRTVSSYWNMIANGYLKVLEKRLSYQDEGRTR